MLLTQGQAAKKVPIDGLTLGPIIVAAGRSKVNKGIFNGMAVSVKVGGAQGTALWPAAAPHVSQSGCLHTMHC